MTRARAGFLAGMLCMACVASRTHADPAAVPTAAATIYSAPALYNAANTYARAGKPGLAVLNYERAALLAPGDPDIEANLRFVRAAAHVTGGPSRWIDRAAQAANPAAAAWLGVAGILLVGTAVLTAPFAPHRRGIRRAAVLAGAALVAFPVAHGVALWPRLHAAVVLTAATPARVSPVPMGDALFELPEAETVVIVAEHEDFVLIRTQAGRRGWVSRANLAPVVPWTSAATAARRLPAPARR